MKLRRGRLDRPVALGSLGGQAIAGVDGWINQGAIDLFRCQSRPGTEPSKALV